MISHCANLIHRPRVFVEPYPGGGGHGFAFLDQGMQQVSKVRELRLSRKVGRMRKAGQGRHAVHRSVKNQLGPLCRTRIPQRVRLESALYQQLGSLLHYCERRVARLKWPKPSRRIEFVLDMCIAVPRSTHECRPTDNMPASMCRDDLLAAQAILR